MNVMRFTDFYLRRCREDANQDSPATLEISSPLAEAENLGVDAKSLALQSKPKASLRFHFCPPHRAYSQSAERKEKIIAALRHPAQVKYTGQ
ncbi:hypothetical protein [Pseudomonas avellanae]|uniref:hypothetical protein n=1 Tax=Pseudomonas avellanae TaxID=46257 RepID=UPI000B24A053|nr:hypothetical protein [Pseudomonas avellanae]UQW68713.1 hypothetical protein L2Y00_26695 [Pseudomonas avellanae]GGJ24790.1 hypothetical protein GCM10009085_18650 [Pseudomonas avellanae]